MLMMRPTTHTISNIRTTYTLTAEILLNLNLPSCLYFQEKKGDSRKNDNGKDKKVRKIERKHALDQEKN